MKETVDYELSKNRGVCIIDLWGLGENSSFNTFKHKRKFDTLARSALWLGKTSQGIWINQLEIVSKWLMESHNVQNISLNANREVAVASLFFSALESKVNKLTLVDIPLSYLFDKDGDNNHTSMAIHIPDILKWGDLSLAAALGNKDITIINPVSISGRELNEVDINSFKNEFNHFNALFGKHSTINFSQ